jgi:trimethylamine--corrinoid protein Co-methyltransferase
VAENISGVVIHQTAAPGAALIFGGAATLFDMRKGTAPMSAVEAVMVDSGYVQVGKSLGMPTHAYMGLSDAKTLDSQAGFETTLGATVAALSGVNIVSGAGLLNYVLCQSLEKLVIDAEICAHAHRLVEGIAFREDDAGYAAIEQNAPSSSFLTSEHTRAFFRKEVYYPDPIIDRVSLGDWQLAGQTSSADRAHEKVKEILGQSESESLDQTTIDHLKELMVADAAEHGLDSLPQGRSDL